MDENITGLEFEADNSKEYKFEAIRDSAVYVKKLELDNLLGLYYVVLGKSYFKEKSTWEPLTTV